MTDDELAEAVVDGLEGWEETDFVCVCRSPYPSLWGRLGQPLVCRECGRKSVTHIYRGRNRRGDCLVDVDF